MTARTPANPPENIAEERFRLERRLARDMAKAITDFSLIEPNDRIMVALSGGKDSHAMLYFLRRFQRASPTPFELIAVHLDQKQPGHDTSALVDYLNLEGYPFEIVREDTYSIVKAKTAPGDTQCVLCSRLRRAILYAAAKRLGCNKIALGHHRDDAIATLLLNLVYAGQLKSMPPKLRSDDGENIVIRPLVYCDEKQIARFALLSNWPILPCNLCGSQPDHQRKAMQTLLDSLETTIPNIKATMLAALRNVRPSHLLDQRLWRKLQLPIVGDAPKDDGENVRAGLLPIVDEGVD
jgi:tRNA 2-thiocytidine biosynthesis protein TtcA